MCRSDCRRNPAWLNRLLKSLGILVLFMVARGGVYAEVPYLRPGETLQYGEWLVSENGQFRMGFDKGGDLVIEDIGEEPLSKFQRIYFSPRAGQFFWPYQGDNIHRQNYRYPWRLDNTPGYTNLRIPDGYSFCSFSDGGSWKLSAEESRDRSAKARTLEISNYQLLVRDVKGQIIWHTHPIPYPDYLGIPHLDPEGGCADWPDTILNGQKPLHEATVTEAVLYLDNTGRAILFSSEKILWCSCPWCHAGVPIKVDFYADPSKWHFHQVKKQFGGMPTHAEHRELTISETIKESMAAYEAAWDAGEDMDEYMAGLGKDPPLDEVLPLMRVYHRNAKAARPPRQGTAKGGASSSSVNAAAAATPEKKR